MLSLFRVAITTEVSENTVVSCPRWDGDEWRSICIFSCPQIIAAAARARSFRHPRARAHTSSSDMNGKEVAECDFKTKRIYFCVSI